MKQLTDEQKERRVQCKKDRNERAAQFMKTVKIGTILIGALSYERTTYRFFQVTEIKKKTIAIREITMDKKSNSNEKSIIMPVIGSFLNTEPIKKVINDNSFFIEGMFVKMWDQIPVSEDWYD